MKETVRQRADAAQDHGADAGILEHFSHEPNGIAGDHVAVGIDPVVKIGVLRIPDPPLREVQVPRQDRPLAAPPCIPVNIPVFTAHIDVPNNRVGGEHVHATRDVDVVIQIIAQVCAG